MAYGKASCEHRFLKTALHILVIFSVSENIIGVLYAAQKKSIILIVKVVVCWWTSISR